LTDKTDKVTESDNSRLRTFTEFIETFECITFKITHSFFPEM
jgi:hypothetical protein